MAERFGILNVEGLLRNLTAVQMRGWEHFYELEPDPELRADYRAASIVQILYNINRGKNQKPLTLEEALLKFGEQKEKQAQTPEQQFAMLRVLAAMHANDAPVFAEAPEGPRSAEEQRVVEEQATQQLAMIEQARKAMH